MGSRPATSPPSTFQKKDETGDGRSTALPYPDYQGQVWLQYDVPEEISVRRGTVAIPALTSGLAAEPCSHVGPSVRLGGGGARLATGGAQGGGSAPKRTRGGRPPKV